MAGTRTENSAPADGEKTRDTQHPSPTVATAAERPKKRAPNVAIRIELIFVVRRTALLRLSQSRSRERYVFSRGRAYSKMWSRRSSPVRLRIHCLFWLACSSKNRGVMKFVSRQKPKRRFINLARTAEYLLTGNFWSETHSGSPNATFTRSML